MRVWSTLRILMPYGPLKQHLKTQLQEMRDAGLYKTERVLTSPQRPHASTAEQPHVLNLCANNYLGLADHPAVIEAAQEALDRWGYGMASVRFICGTQEPHKQLESALSDFLGTDDTILYSSCWDANGGLFETILGPEDAIISDELNHASIIDGIRLCKAKRLRYKNNDMADLEAKLKEAADARFRLIATDGVFSHGRLHRRPAGGLRPGRPLRRPGDGGRLPRRRLPRRRAAAARPNTAASPAGSTSSPAPSAKPSAAAPAATPPAAGRSSTCSASARGRTCSPTPCRRRSWPRRSRRWS